MDTRRLFPKHKGFTLIEMILYVSICSLLLLSLSLFAVYLFSSRVKNQSIADVNQEGLQIMQIMTQTIRNGRAINTPSIGSSGSSLSVNVVDPLLSPTVFDLSGGVMRVTEGAGSPVPLTNSHVTVSSLTFQNISSASSTDRIVSITFTIQHINNGNRAEQTFSQTFTGSATLRQ